MRLRLVLSEADRERYGGPESLLWDSTRLAVSEAELLQELLGVSVAVYRKSWMASGEPITWRWAFWLSLRRAGVEVPWDDFDPDILGGRAEKLAEPEGKDPSSTPPSPSDSGGSSSPPP